MDYIVNFGYSHTALTPVFTVFKQLDTLVDIAKPVISEVSHGLYKFSYTPSTYSVVFQIDAGDPSITDENLRYVSGVLGNIDYEIEFLRKVSTNKWQMIGNQVKIFDDDGTTVIKTFNLYDSLGNPTMTNVHL